MKYKVTFRQRFNAIGDPSDTPERVFAAPDDVVTDEQFVERIEPPSLHSEDAMEEDDNFLAFGSATWIYEVADGRDREFLNALQETELVLHVEKLTETPEYMM
ncbi:MAG: hypothetical protein IT168_21490 [Bryobacterales bacterium]|nr:hypothetical protein [Bryobacterales bacterium]